ncbi:MAG: outer membrane beta-barrel protein [Planctomycetes bacterium]|nr:outer membrane beta-barrel protein [Planctomycetota bacterium]
MKRLALALPFLVLSAAAAWADEICLPKRMSLDEDPPRDRQDVELERQRPDDTASLTPMEFVYRHSQFEVGTMYTDFDNSLGLKSHLGYYVRWGVEVVPHLTVHLTYRYNAFDTGSPGEDIRAQALLFGASYHVPLTREFAFVGGLGIGPSWWDSSAFKSSTGFTFSGEIGVTAKLWEMLRLKTGIVFDAVGTDFRNSSGVSVNLSYLVGLELGL